MRARTALLAGPVALAVAGVLAAAPAGAATSKVAGVQAPVDPAIGHYTMAGDLIGHTSPRSNHVWALAEALDVPRA